MKTDGRDRIRQRQDVLSRGLPRRTRWAAAAALILCACFSFAEEAAEGASIVKKSWSTYRDGVGSEHEEIHLLIRSQGRDTEKALDRWVLYQTSGEDKIAIRFTKPARERIKALIYRHPGGADEQWLKLPSMQRARSIKPDDGSYFAGTDLIYEDLRQLAGEQMRDFDYQLLRTQKESENARYVIEARPRKDVQTAYVRRVMEYNASNVCTRIEYYGSKGLVKEQVNSEISYDKAGRWRLGKMLLKNHLLERETHFEILRRDFPAEVPADVFDKGFLTSERF